MMTKKQANRPKAAEALMDKWFKKMADATEDQQTVLSPGLVQVLQNYHRSCSELKRAIYLYIAYFSFGVFGQLAEPIRTLFTHLDNSNSGTILQDDIKYVLQR